MALSYGRPQYAQMAPAVPYAQYTQAALAVPYGQDTQAARVGPYNQLAQTYSARQAAGPISVPLAFEDIKQMTSDDPVALNDLLALRSDPLVIDLIQAGRKATTINSDGLVVYPNGAVVPQDEPRVAAVKAGFEAARIYAQINGY